MARQLYAGGYRLTELRQLRGKSVDFVQDVWAGRRADPETGKIRVIGSGTQATRMTTLRAICRYAGKPGLVPKSNKAAGLPPRERTPVADIAWKLSDQDLGKVNNAERPAGVADCSRILRAQEKGRIFTRRQAV